MSVFEFTVDRQRAGEKLHVGKSEVEASTDVEWLTASYQKLDDEAIEMREFLAAYRAAQIDDDDYFERTAGKLAYCKIAMVWIERRLIRLGADVPYSPSDPRSRQLRLMGEQAEKMRQRIARLEKIGGVA